MSPHGNICCDRAPSPIRGPQTLQQVHFRPSAPYPRIIWIAGQEAYPYPLPQPQMGKVYPPTQAGRFTIKGPSATGPWTYRDTSGLYPIYRTGGVGTGQSRGLT